jgi:hypothetical protein
MMVAELREKADGSTVHLECSRQRLSVLIKICQTVHLLSISTGQGTLILQLRRVTTTAYSSHLMLSNKGSYTVGF